MNALRVLAAIFDIDTGTASTKLKQLDGHLADVKKTLATVGESLVGAFSVHKLAEFVSQQIEIGSAINDTAEKLGVGTDELQKFQFAAKLSGVEAEGAAQALGFLNKNVGEALGGNKEAAATFAGLGIDIKDAQGNVRELGDILPELADSFESMHSSQERTATAMKIFGKSGAALIPLLKSGSSGLQEMFDKFDQLGGGMQKDFISAADEAGDEIDSLKFAFQGLKSRIAVEVLPGITDLVRKFQGFVGGAIELAKNTNIVKEALFVLGVVGAAAGAKAAIGWGKFFGIIPKNANIFKTLLNLGELGLIIAGVAVLFLLFEDFFTMVRGGQSVIGDLIEEFLGVGESTKLVEQLHAAWALVSGMWAGDLQQLKPVFAAIENAVGGILPRMVAYFVDSVRLVTALFVGVMAVVKAFSLIHKAITDDGDLSGLSQLFEGTKETLFGKGGLLSESASGNLTLRNKVKGQAEDRFGKERDEEFRTFVPRDLEVYNPTPTVPVPGASNVTGDTTITQTNNNTINVQGGNTNAETGKAVANALKGALTQGDLQAAFAGFGGGR